eukprot:Hpha_TRINITY_DN9151_c0_g1::TRINITY_DN9151_c0_g1_i1::g.94395::m.94395
MAFAPPPKGAPQPRPGRGAVRSPASGRPRKRSTSRARAEGGGSGVTVPTPRCWLSGVRLPRFGWSGLPESLRTHQGAALNYFTLSPAAASALADGSLPEGELLTRCSDRLQAEGQGAMPARSEPFVVFLREYKLLLESVGERRAAAPDSGPTRCLDPGSIEQLKARVSGALALPGMFPDERSLLELELGNLKEQDQINKVYPPSNGAPAAPSAPQAPAVPSGSPSAAKAGQPHAVSGRVGVPAGYPLVHASTSSGGDRSTEALAEHRLLSTPSPHGARAGPWQPEETRTPLDSAAALRLQRELRRLQTSNAEALRGLSTLTRQYRELTAVHQGVVHERDELRREKERLALNLQKARQAVSPVQRRPSPPRGLGADARREIEAGQAEAVTLRWRQEATLREAAQAETVRLRDENILLTERLASAERMVAALSRGPVVAQEELSRAADQLSRANDARRRAEDDANTLKMLNSGLEEQIRKLRQDAGLASRTTSPQHPHPGLGAAGPRRHGAPLRFGDELGQLEQLQQLAEAVALRQASNDASIAKMRDELRGAHGGASPGPGLAAHHGGIRAGLVSPQSVERSGLRAPPTWPARGWTPSSAEAV